MHHTQAGITIFLKLACFCKLFRRAVVETIAQVDLW